MALGANYDPLVLGVYDLCLTQTEYNEDDDLFYEICEWRGAMKSFVRFNDRPCVKQMAASIQFVKDVIKAVDEGRYEVDTAAALVRQNTKGLAYNKRDW